MPSPLPQDLPGTSIPLIRLCRSEVRKLTTTRSSLVLVAVMILGPALICGLMRGLSSTGHDVVTYWDGCLALLSLFLPIQAALTVTSEWGNRTAGHTFLFEPRRLRVIAAKGLVVLVLSLLLLTIALLWSYIVYATRPTPDGVPVSAFPLLARSLEHLLAAAQGFAFGLLLRHTAAAICVNLFIPYVFTFLTGTLHLGSVGHWVNPLLTQQALTASSMTTTEWVQLLASSAGTGRASRHDQSES